MTNRFIGIKETLHKTSLSKTQLYERLRNGDFPTSVELGPQKVVFIEAEIDSWMANQARRGQPSKTIRVEKARTAVNARRDRGAAS